MTDHNISMFAVILYRVPIVNRLELSENIMRCTIILFAVLAVYLFAQGGAQTCPGSGSCNCKIDNIESLLALVRDKIETQVEQEVMESLANTSSKGCNEYGIPWHVPTSFFTWIYKIKLHI